MRLFRVRRIVVSAVIVLLLSLVVFGGDACAQGYPRAGRPITLMVPYAPGGATDTGARLMAAGMEPILKTSVQVVNRPGAGSEVGLTQLVRARPDGYTLSYLVVPTVVTHYLDPARQAIYTRASFQPIGPALPLARHARGALRQPLSHAQGTSSTPPAPPPAPSPSATAG